MSSLAELYINPQPTRCDERVRVLVCENDIPYLLLHIFIEVDEDGCFRQVLCNDKYVTIMLGQHIHLVEVVSKEIKNFHLHDYVGHAYSIPDCSDVYLSESFLVTTYCYVFLIDIVKGIIWRSKRCGIDGVVIHDISDGVIYGEGDWDPPGGWLAFRLSLKNGELMPD
ncbi:hypothetical protein [Dickeya zeae]|uniref:hypothetical protein n=1 Tax=Dickeya zeae TaxID=204042 RepID=UPI00215D69EC|nr:hypothetical protein [Dickeya zeae]